MSKAHAKPRTAEMRPGAMVSPAPLPSAAIGDAPADDARQRQQVCDFIRAMSAELSVLAHKNGLESLALIFETAREAAEAEAIVQRRIR